MVPVLTTGGAYPITAQFCRGPAIDTVATATALGCKLDGDFTGPIVSSDDTAAVNGDGSFSFLLDLTTADAKAYFIANPAESTTSAVIVFTLTVDGHALKTAPFSIVLQNDYLPDQ